MRIEARRVPEQDPGAETEMTRLHETIETPLPLDEAFAFVADFANAQH